MGFSRVLLLGLCSCHVGAQALHGPARSTVEPAAPIVARVDPAGFAPPIADPELAGRSPGVAALGPRAPTLVSESAQPFVHFARPMIADAAALHFELDPPLPGSTVWVDPYRAWFVPDGALELGRSYRVHAHGELLRDDGSKVSVDERWELRTRPPWAELTPDDAGARTSFVDDDHDDDDGIQPAAIRAAFHAKVAVDVRSELRTTAAELRKHLRARAWRRGADPSTARPVAIRIYGHKQRHPLPADLEYVSEDSLHVHPATSWPAGHEIEVTLDAAFAPAGAGAIGKPVTTRFEISDGPRIRMICDEDHGDGCGPGGVSFELDAPFREADLRRIDVSPRPKRFARDVWGDQHVSLRGEFELGVRYRVRIPADLRDRIGQRVVGERPKLVTFVPPPPQVALVGTAGILRPDQPVTVGLESRWLHDATLRAAVPTEQAWRALEGQSLDEVPFPVDVEHKLERRIDLAPGGRYAWSSIALDIAELAGGKRRPVFVEIVPGRVMASAKDRPRAEVTRGLYQVTDLGLAAWISAGESRVQVRRNATTAPVAGARVALVDDAGKTTHELRTGSDGIAKLPRHADPAVLVVRNGDDRVLVELSHATPAEAAKPRESWQRDRDDELLAELVTERGIYLPGDTVSMVGWTAISTPRTGHGLAMPPRGTKVVLELHNPGDEVVARREVKITRHGKFWGRIRVPERAGLGRWTAVAKIGKQVVEASFVLRDVRPPQFEVRAAALVDARHRGEPAEVVAHASYYFGGAVPISEARAHNRCAQREVVPPGLEPGWELARVEHPRETYYELDQAVPSRIAEDGSVHATVATDTLAPGTDYVCSTDLALQDATFEEVGGTAQWFVYPSRYLAVRRRGDERDPQHPRWELRAVDRDGKQRIVQSFELELSRIDDRRDKDGTVREHPVRVHRCRKDTRSSGDDIGCDPGKLAPGRYRVALTATIDEAAMKWRDQLWIYAPPAPVAPRPAAARTWLELSAAPSDPKPGDEVVVTVLGPLVDGHGMLARSHVGLRELIPFELKAGKAELKLRATDAWIPGIELHAFVVAPGATAKDRLQQWSDHTSITVGPESRRLTVAITAAEVTTAGAELPIEVVVQGADGKPVRGRVALWAVDEALHSLVAPHIPDLVREFAAARRLPTQFVETFSKVMRPYEVREDPYEHGWSYGSGSGFGSGGGGGGAGFGGRGLTAPSVRQRFEGTPIFIGDAELDAHGRAQLHGTMPDNLTTFRLTAIASADATSGAGLARFGHSDARVRVTAPLVVRAVTPRLLRPDDEAELAAMVENLGGTAGEAQLELKIVKGSKLIEIVEAPASKLQLAAGGQARVPFRVRAKQVGTVELELHVRMPAGGLRDAVRVTLPIERNDELRQHAASYGSFDRDGAYAITLGHPTKAPNGAVDVEVELAGTMLAGLEPMARDLAQYPYGCVEQTTSGLLPLVALAGLRHQGWLDIDVDEHLAVGIERLRAMQLPSGALSYWAGGTTEHIWGTAYALWVLEQLKATGYDVPMSLRRGMRDALRERLGAASEGSGEGAGEGPGDPWERLGIEPVAAVIAVQALVAAGERPLAQLDALIAHRDELPTFARALLLLAAHELDPKHARTRTLLSELRGVIDEREGSASVRLGSSYFDEYFDSSARTDAMVLLALVAAAPDDVLVEKLARGLGELRHGGSLGNTQERAYGLLALSAYGRARETVIPELTAELWIDGKDGGASELHGRKAPPVHRNQRVLLGATKGDERVTVRRSGKGRLYWRVGMSWAPPDAGRTADAHGVAITRSLRTAQARTTDKVAAGQLVAMDVTVTVDRTQRYLAIDLPLPPGLEAVDESLGAGARARVLPAHGGGWVSHRELRRDRAVLFADVLRAGEHTATVFLRATTPGRFAMPAAVAHAMYAPERRGHTADAEVVVTERTSR